MVRQGKNLIRIDLNQFKLHIKNDVELSLHFDSPSRRFYLSVIALVATEMKKQGKVTSVLLEKHYDLIALLNETVGGSAGSSRRENLLPRIYKKWKGALPNLEGAPLFKVLGRRKEYDDGVGKTYKFSEKEKDIWANLFEYKGSGENVRLRFSVDNLGANLDDVVITYGESPKLEDVNAWERFIEELKKGVEDRPRPIDEYPVSTEPGTEVSSSKKSIWFRLSGLQKMALMVTVSLLVAFAVTVIWRTYSRLPPALESVCPDKPYIAVLPFVNLSGDPTQKYFSDGLAINIITQLYKMPNMFVIAYQSSFKYRGKAVKVQQVGQELGVRYVLEGSVQKAGDRIRINAQLVDAETGNHLWAERYDRELKDVFAVQDEIIRKVVAEIAVETTWGEMGRLMTYSTENFEALDCQLKAYSLYQRFEKESNAQARELLERAIELDPKYAFAMALLGYIHLEDARQGWVDNPGESFKQAEELANRALAIDDTVFMAHMLLGGIYQHKGLYEQAIAARQRAVECEPNNAVAINSLVQALIFAGRPEEALKLSGKAMRLSPYPPPYFFFNAVMANYLTGRYEGAIIEFKNKLEHFPSSSRLDLDRLWMIASYMELGREKEARSEARSLLDQRPDFSIEAYIESTKRSLAFRDYAFLDHQIELLHNAGLK
jgi:TolB-like protein/Tfp pilus assembly protein PilF